MKFRLVFFNELHVALRPDDDQRCPAQGILQSFSLAVSLFLLRGQVGIADNLVMMQDNLEGVELGGRNQRSIRGFRESLIVSFGVFYYLIFFFQENVCVHWKRFSSEQSWQLSCVHDGSWASLTLPVPDPCPSVCSVLCGHVLSSSCA